jgi:hypothetical protein
MFGQSVEVVNHVVGHELIVMSDPQVNPGKRRFDRRI